MGNFLVQNRQRNELRQLKMAILNFQNEMLALRAGYSGKVISEDDDLIKILDDIEGKIENLLKAVSSFKSGIRVRSHPVGNGRNSVFESELGRVGQMRGELALLQGQLLQLKEKIPELRGYLVDRMNDPLKTGARNVDQLKELSKTKVKYENIKQELSASPYDSIHQVSPPQASLDGFMIGLTALLYLFIKKAQNAKG